MRVGVLVNLCGIFVGGAVFSAYGCPESAGVEDINVWIVIHSGRPFRTKVGPVGGIDLVFESIHQVLYILLVVLDTVIDPEIGMRRDVA